MVTEALWRRRKQTTQRRRRMARSGNGNGATKSNGLAVKAAALSKRWASRPVKTRGINHLTNPWPPAKHVSRDRAATRRDPAGIERSQPDSDDLTRSSAASAGCSEPADRLESAVPRLRTARTCLEPPSREHGWPPAAAPPATFRDWESAQPMIPPDRHRADTTGSLELDGRGPNAQGCSGRS